MPIFALLDFQDFEKIMSAGRTPCAHYFFEYFMPSKMALESNVVSLNFQASQSQAVADYKNAAESHRTGRDHGVQEAKRSGGD